MKNIGKILGFLLIISVMLFVLYLYVAVSTIAYEGIFSADTTERLLAGIIIAILLNGVANAYKRNT